MAALASAHAGPVVPVSDVPRAVAFWARLGVDGEPVPGGHALHFGDGPQRTDARGIADLGEVRLAWSRDPDDQVFSIFERA